MALVDANGLPIAVQVASAQPREVKLAFDLVQGCWTEALPERVIGGYPHSRVIAYDSDPLDAELADCGVETIAPHRRNRKKANKTQDGRPPRRYKRRWKVDQSC
jgi:hypothetical protein